MNDQVKAGQVAALVGPVDSGKDVLFQLLTGRIHPTTGRLRVGGKETKTMQALLVSPASIGQVVAGKALAGSFYILVTAIVIFAFSWTEVIHWDMVMLFVVAGGIFSVAVGLVLGSFYEKQQDIAGWMTLLLVLLVGSVLVTMLGVDLPALVERILPWVPSVALAEIYRAAFSETVSTSQVRTNLWIILAVSLPL